MKPTSNIIHKLSTSFMALATAFTANTALAAGDDFVLEEIVVTAQKRSQNLQDVPSSVATLGGEKMSVLKSGGADIKFMSARVPSLYIETSFGRTFPRFYIRGLGNSDFDLNASQPVSLIYDEVVLENPILKGAPIFDLDRVEVLR
ncbi:TonB-dependent receptor, partial [hydrothermal vent metagenome]